MSQETIEVRYRELTPMSRQMFEDGRSVNAGAAKGAYFFSPYPITLRRGKGCVLEDVDGRSYVDFSNHHTAQVLGHNHPAIVEAVERQLVDGIALGAATGVETRLARMMCERISSVERIRFCQFRDRSHIACCPAGEMLQRQAEDRKVRGRLSRESRCCGN